MIMTHKREGVIHEGHSVNEIPLYFLFFECLSVEIITLGSVKWIT